MGGFWSWRPRTRCERADPFGRTNGANGEDVLRCDVAGHVLGKRAPFVFFAKVASLLSLAIDLVNQAHSGALLGDFELNPDLGPLLHQGPKGEYFSVLWPCCIEPCAEEVNLRNNSALAHFMHCSRGPFALSVSTGGDTRGKSLNAANEPTQAEANFHRPTYLLSEGSVSEPVANETPINSDAAPDDVDMVVRPIQVPDGNELVLLGVDPMSDEHLNRNSLPVLFKAFTWRY